MNFVRLYILQFNILLNNSTAMSQLKIKKESLAHDFQNLIWIETRNISEVFIVVKKNNKVFSFVFLV
jgi:hypothetical protein